MGKVRIYDVKKREFDNEDFKDVLRLQILVSNLESRGVFVDFYNKVYDPEVFEETEVIRNLLAEEGESAFPCVTEDEYIVHRGSYPTNEQIICLLDQRVDLFDLETEPGEGGCGDCSKCGGHC